METKYGLIVMCESGNDHPGGQGRMLHSLKAAQAFRADGVPVRLYFHGIGVQWLTLFEARPDKFTHAPSSICVNRATRHASWNSAKPFTRWRLIWAARSAVNTAPAWRARAGSHVNMAVSIRCCVS